MVVQLGRNLSTGVWTRILSATCQPCCSFSKPICALGSWCLTSFAIQGACIGFVSKKPLCSLASANPVPQSDRKTGNAGGVADGSGKENDEARAAADHAGFSPP